MVRGVAVELVRSKVRYRAYEVCSQRTFLVRYDDNSKGTRLMRELPSFQLSAGRLKYDELATYDQPTSSTFLSDCQSATCLDQQSFELF